MNIEDAIRKGLAGELGPALAALGIGGGKPAPANLGNPTTQDQPTEEHPVLKAAFAAGVKTPEDFAKLAGLAAEAETLKAAQNAPAEEHPVLKAALAADCDTAEKFSQLAGEAQAGREALPDARENAHKAAIAYYGTNAEGLAAAKELIDQETSFKQLNATAERYWAGAPGQDHQGKRLSQPNAQSPQGQRDGTAASGKSKAELAKEESPEGAKFRVMGGGGHDYYAQFNHSNNAPAGATR